MKLAMALAKYKLHDRASKIIRHSQRSTTNHAKHIVVGRFRTGTVRDFLIRSVPSVAVVKRGVDDEKDDVVSSQIQS